MPLRPYETLRKTQHVKSIVVRPDGRVVKDTKSI